MRHLKTALALLALVGLIAVAGCGGGDDSTSTDSTATSTESTSTDATSAATDSTATSADPAADEYGQQLTQIIGDFGTNFQALGPKIQSSSNPQEFNQLLGQAESGIQGTIDDLKALDPPEGAQEGQDMLIAAFEGYAAKLKAAGDAVSSGDQKAVKQATSELQAGVGTFQSDLQSAVQSLQDAGVQLGAGG